MLLLRDCGRSGSVTNRSDVTTDHEADVLGEGVNEVEHGGPGVGVARHHQTLRPGGGVKRGEVVPKP